MVGEKKDGGGLILGKAGSMQGGSLQTSGGSCSSFVLPFSRYSECFLGVLVVPYRRLKAEGEHSVEEICQMLGVGRSTLYRYLGETDGGGKRG